ncbi:unnamed protein product [Echinostoma caproni]|uniref:ANK_REP_REGION domain-containing protein n=1 Tax=Echinostoma caproni TaxID=27848 RepID=A0A183A7B4_9TREM|nr:unnamed protein product [Echinostoma caproni]
MQYGLKSRRVTVRPVISEDELEPPSYDQIQAIENPNHEPIDSEFAVQQTARKPNTFRIRGNITLGNRRRLSRVAKWMRQSVNSLSTIDEVCRGEGLVGINKRWRWNHQKRTSALLRELQMNPMLPFEVNINTPDAKGNRPIHLVAMSGNLEVFEYLAHLNVDMSCTNKDHQQPIHLAAMKNHSKFLEISHGAEIYVPNLHHSYPVHIALENLSHRCLCVLFENEKRAESAVSVQSPSPEPDLEHTETRRESFASRKRSEMWSNVPVIESYAAPKLSLINLVDSEGDTPLHTAVRAGDLVGIKTCLDNGASILVMQNERETPIHYACSKSDLDAVKIMLESCPSQLKLVMTMANKSGYTPLHLATLYDHVPLLDYLVEKVSLSFWQYFPFQFCKFLQINHCGEYNNFDYRVRR